LLLQTFAGSDDYKFLVGGVIFHSYFGEFEMTTWFYLYFFKRIEVSLILSFILLFIVDKKIHPTHLAKPKTFSFEYNKTRMMVLKLAK